MLFTIGLVFMSVAAVDYTMGSSQQFVLIPQALQGQFIVFGIGMSKYRLLIILICGLLTIGLQLIIAKTRFGSRLRAAVDDRRVARGLGGEQQMLAVGRASVLNPRVMLLDEPLEGLAPIIVDELLGALRSIIRDEGVSAILVEQNAKKIFGVTDHAVIVERGAVVHAAQSATLLADRVALETRLGVTDSGPRKFRHATR